MRNLVDQAHGRAVCRTTDVEIRVPNSQWIFAVKRRRAVGFGLPVRKRHGQKVNFRNPFFYGRWL